MVVAIRVATVPLIKSLLEIEVSSNHLFAIN